MSFIPREIESRINRFFLPNKVLVILGARRIGKTLFLREFVKDLDSSILQLNGEDLSTHDILKTRSVENYKRILGKNMVLIIDEAQKIPDIGGILKLMVDEIPGIRIVATGSSMFDLNNQLGEPLTGRKFTFLMFPFAQMEYNQIENPIQTYSNLEERLIYGSYPELLQYASFNEKASYLKELIQSYLLKDILELDGLRNSSKMFDLLRLIAFQIGKEVSLEELGRQLSMSKNTVERYLDLLSKVFVIFKVSGFSKNLRKEISKSNKWYFVDNGIRNAIIANFNPIGIRNDIGDLWENYVISERIKYQNYMGMSSNNYFWRTYQQQEIDWIEERDGNLFAYEMKWKQTNKIKAPSAWRENYPESEFSIIHSGNYLDWILPNP